MLSVKDGSNYPDNQLGILHLTVKQRENAPALPFPPPRRHRHFLRLEGKNGPLTPARAADFSLLLLMRHLCGAPPATAAPQLPPHHHHHTPYRGMSPGLGRGDGAACGSPGSHGGRPPSASWSSPALSPSSSYQPCWLLLPASLAPPPLAGVPTSVGSLGSD